MPLETLVERETVRPPADPAAAPRQLRLATEAGLHFLRILALQPMSTDYRDAFLRVYPFPALTDDQRAASDSAVTPIARTMIRARIGYRGTPAPAFWQFDDAQVNCGSVDAGPTDRVRMLLVEFTLVYGSDWFVLPIELDVGSLCRTQSL